MSESHEIFPNGKVSMEGTTATITFRRHFPYPISSVWSELTDPKKREKWFGKTRIDLTGEMSITMTAEYPPLPPEQRSTCGRILVWDPPRVFEHEYSQAGIGPTVLRYELEADGDSTILTLIHRGLELASVGHDASCLKGIECACKRTAGIPFEDLVPGTVSREIYADLAKYFYQTTLSVIDEFMRTLDYWTFEKRSHSYRVARQSILLGTHMGMGTREIFLLGAGALLHDIGKIRVPREILMNTGVLTDAEWEILKQHPVFGEQILNQFPSLRFAWEIVTQHHEQWDGAGYPRGLRGEEISKVARIFSVVDSYDAMTQIRTYKENKSHEEAMEEISEMSGIMYDPEVVEQYLSFHEKKMSVLGSIEETPCFLKEVLPADRFCEHVLNG